MNDEVTRLETILLQAKDDHALVSVYADSENLSNFAVGRVLGVSEEEVLLAMISASGRYDGYKLIKIEKIFRINLDGLYESMIEELFAGEAKQHALFPVDESDLMGTLLAFSKQNRLIVCIEVLDSGYDDVQGFFDARNRDALSISCISDYGDRDGRAWVTIADITRISCDGEEEQIIKRLFMNKQKV